MFRELLEEYFQGVLTSLQGFRTIHKLDRQQNEKEKTKKRYKETRKHTILEARRQHIIDEKNSQIAHQQKELNSNRSALLRIFKCITANIGSVVFTCLFTSITEKIEQPILHSFFKYTGSLVMLLMFLIIRVLSTLWFADIAGAALKYRHHTGNKIHIAKAASDFIHAILLEVVFLAQTLSIIAIDVPILSPVLGFIFMSLLHSMYCFDYIWMANGITLKTRISMIEHNWAFHVGYGTLLTVLTAISANFMINACIFGALFPFFVISSCLADVDMNKNNLNNNDRTLRIPPVHFFYVAQTLVSKFSFAVIGKSSC